MIITIISKAKAHQVTINFRHLSSIGFQIRQSSALAIETAVHTSLDIFKTKYKHFIRRIDKLSNKLCIVNERSFQKPMITQYHNQLRRHIAEPHDERITAKVSLNK